MHCFENYGWAQYFKFCRIPVFATALSWTTVKYIKFRTIFFSHPVCTLCMVLSVTTSHRGFNFLLKNARTQGVDTRGCSEMANEFLDIISKSAKIQKPCSSNNFLRFVISFCLGRFHLIISVICRKCGLFRR